MYQTHVVKYSYLSPNWSGSIKKKIDPKNRNKCKNLKTVRDLIKCTWSQSIAVDDNCQKEDSEEFSS